MMAPNAPYPRKINSDPAMKEIILKRKKPKAEYETLFKAINIESMLRAIDWGTSDKRAIVVRVNLRFEGSVR